MSDDIPDHMRPRLKLLSKTQLGWVLKFQKHFRYWPMVQVKNWQAEMTRHIERGH
jgi:hypothetical protein